MMHGLLAAATLAVVFLANKQLRGGDDEFEQVPPPPMPCCATFVAKLLGPSSLYLELQRGHSFTTETGIYANAHVDLKHTRASSRVLITRAS